MELNAAPPKPFFERNWVKYGLIAGGISSLIMVVFYATYEWFFVDMVLGFIPLIVMVIIGILGAIKEKKDRGGYIEYGRAVGVSIGVVFIGSLVYMGVELILHFVIDTGLLQRIHDMQDLQFERMADRGWFSQAQLDAYREQTKDWEPTDGQKIFSCVGKVLVHCILAMIVFLISSIFIRKDPDAI
jgi:hypothetical protein